MLQIGFLEIAIILILGLIIIGPSRLPEVIRSWLKFYKKFQNHLTKFKNELEKDIGTDELKKDVFNEMRMEELEGFDKQKDD